jgi:hypothetical protein
MSWKDGQGPGKGPERRPSAVSDAEYAHHYARTFSRDCDPDCPYCKGERPSVEGDAREGYTEKEAGHDGDGSVAGDS